MGAWTQLGVGVAKLFGLGVLAAEVAELKDKLAASEKREKKADKALAELTDKLFTCCENLEATKGLLDERDNEIVRLKNEIHFLKREKPLDESPYTGGNP